MPGTDDQIDVNYSVEEQPSGSIMASIGFAQNAGLILGGSISQNNFLGTGNRVSLGLTRSEYQSRYNFGFVDPYWTEDGVSLATTPSIAPPTTTSWTTMLQLLGG